jgi:hypothetical protein
MIRFRNSIDAESEDAEIFTLTPPTSTDDQVAWKQLYIDGLTRAEGDSLPTVNFD